MKPFGGQRSTVRKLGKKILGGIKSNVRRNKLDKLDKADGYSSVF